MTVDEALLEWAKVRAQNLGYTSASQIKAAGDKLAKAVEDERRLNA